LTRSRLLLLLPLLIAAVAFGLRIQGLDWDGGHFFHPDERSIYMRAEQMHRTLIDGPGWQLSANQDFPLDEPGFPGIGTFFDKDASPLNPHWFSLGTIAIYILVIVRAVMGLFMDNVSLQDLAIAGRVIGALVDTGTVVMLYLLGRRLFSPAVGLLAMALGAFTVINIQLAHFYRPELFVMFLALATLWWVFNVLDHGRRRDHLLLGTMVGLSFAFRSSSGPLLLPVFAVYGLIAWRRWQAQGPARPLAVIAPVMLWALAAGATSLAVFVFVQPYALLDYRQYLGNLGWELNMVRSAGSVPFTIQYVDIARNGLYEIRQSALWAFGLPLGLVAWGGLAISVVMAFLRPRARDVLLLVYGVPLFLTIAMFEVKFLRYISPVLPLMLLLGSHWLVAGYRWARSRSVGLERVALGGIAFVFIATAWYGLAFVGTYSEDHPGVQASEWINANVEQNSLVLAETFWDEGIPDLGRYSRANLRAYEADTLSKTQRTSDLLADADYLVSYSNRAWGSVLRVPERYPYTSAMYRALFDGSLGYELVQAFERYPTLAGVSWVHDPFTFAGVATPEELPGTTTGALAFNLGWADENVANYDRPLVLLWQNTRELTRNEIQDLMVDVESPPTVQRAMLSDEAVAKQQAGGTWAEVFSEGGINGVAPWLVWLLALELIYLATLPLAVRTLRWLPDRGVVFARPLGLLLVSWLVWMGASTGLWDFSRATVLLSVGLVAAVSGVVFYRNQALLKEYVRRHWRYILTAEMLFLVAYLVFVMIRAANPDLWHAHRGGEKPMDLAYLTAVARSTTFPPYDPWYSGGFINYYYFGFVLVATLMRMTAIVPAVAYNLAVPMLFALTLTGAFSVGYNITEGLRSRMQLRVSGRSTVVAGVVTAMLVVVLANLDGAAQLLQATQRTLQGGLFGHFDFWRSSRLMPGQISITEFPFWTFLFADLHAHLISLPYQVLAIGLAVNLALSARSPVRMVRRLPAFVWLAFTVGTLAAINTWDVPTYGLLSVGTLAVVVLASRRGPLRAIELGKWLLLSGAFFALLYLFFLPFHQNYEAPFSGLRMSQWRTVTWHYMGIHGLLFFLAGTWIAVEAYRRFLGRPRTSPGPGAVPASAFRRWPAEVSAWLTIALTVTAIVLALVLWIRVPLFHQWTTVAVLMLVAVVALAVLAWWAAHRDRPEMPLLVLLAGMLMLAVGIGIGVDFVTAVNDIDRMNTVFKFYLNAWVLYGVVGGVGLWQLWATGALRVRGIGRWRFAKGGWLFLLLVLVLSSSIFPILGTRARIADRFDTNIPLTLDGTAYQQTAIYGDPGRTDNQADDLRYALAPDAEALEFIRQKITGAPVFVEMVMPREYRWMPRTSKYTGMPVVMAWRWHQVQQRGAGGQEPANVERRMADVRALYSTNDPVRARALLAKYNVSYIYVGPTERLYVDEPGLAKFTEMEGTDLDVIFDNGEVKIYRVLPSVAAPA